VLIVRDYQTISKIKHPVLSGVETRSFRNLKGKAVKDLDLRIFEIQPETDNPLHAHAYSHDLFVIRGTGLIRLEERELRIGEGDVASIASYQPHAFVNDSDEVLQFLCMDCTVVEP
jgi:quercetin dioxygenase-like cupin family protein